jgi:ABC-type nitrate/sulfonate/bicarbonate transport system substrate-binding protein
VDSRFRPTLTLTAALVLVATAACGGDDGGGGGASGGDSEERLSIEMGMAHEDTFTAEWWGWLAAREMGYYDELNLDVTFTGTGGSGDVIEQIAAGNMPAGNPSMPSVGEALLSGIPLVNVYTYSNGAIFGIFAPEDSGIESVADLDGKKIGISEPGGGEVAFLEAALREEGIDPITDVTLIPIGAGGPETLAALDGGEVDAYSTAYNDIFALQAAGVTLNDLTPGIFNDFPARGIITTPQVVEEDAEALRRLARGTAMGTHFCFTNFDACEQMLREEIPQVWEEGENGVSQGALRYELAQKQVKPVDPETYGAHNTEATQAFIDTIASTMESAPEVELESFLNEDFLDYANDFDRARVEDDANNYK